MIKIAVIRKRKGGYYVLSEKGKSLGGPYKTYAAAEKRLAQVEMFKHMKKKKSRKKALQLTLDLHKHAASLKPTYSSIMRDLRLNYDDETRLQFMKSFKEAFDQAFIDGQEDPSQSALLEAIQKIDYQPSGKTSQTMSRMVKMAQSVIQMGDPVEAGKGIAAIMRFLLTRISLASRPNAISGLRDKIHKLDPHQISSKKLPASASIGQSLTFLKTILMGHDPMYIKRVLEEVSRSL